MQIHNSLKTPSQRNLHLAKLVSFSLFLVFASAIATAQRAAPDLPAQVAIPANLRIPVVLDTPLSSGISKQGKS